jgi:hypothetical protein
MLNISPVSGAAWAAPANAYQPVLEGAADGSAQTPAVDGPSQHSAPIPEENNDTSASKDSEHSLPNQEESASEKVEKEQILAQLKARDSQVRAHESAHLSAAGAYASGGATYTYQTGPDGRQYAIGGEVSIDVSPIQGDPQATIQKAAQVRAAAMAPADPSGTDAAVANAASSMEQQARAQVVAEQMAQFDKQQEKTKGENDNTVEETNLETKAIAASTSDEAKPKASKHAAKLARFASASTAPTASLVACAACGTHHVI